MKNNKILMSLVAASIAAMAVAPELIKDKKTESSSDNKKVIDLSQKFTKNKDVELVASVNEQMSSILSKKTPVMKVSESINTLVENYGSSDGSIKEKIYKELNLAQYNADSTVGADIINNTKTTGQAPAAAVSCHAACHGACHAACHGSRGWR